MVLNRQQVGKGQVELPVVVAVETAFDIFPTACKPQSRQRVNNLLSRKVLQVIIEREEREVDRDEEGLLVVELVLWDVGVDVEDAAAELVGREVAGGGFDESRELARHGVQAFVEVAGVGEDELLAEVVAVDEDLREGVGFGDHDDDPVLQGHRQPEFGQRLLNKLTTALDNHIIRGLHVCW